MAWVRLINKDLNGLFLHNILKYKRVYTRVSSYVNWINKNKLNEFDHLPKTSFTSTLSPISTPTSKQQKTNLTNLPTGTTGSYSGSNNPCPAGFVGICESI